MCLSGNRSSKSHPVSANVDLAYSDGHLPSSELLQLLVSSSCPVLYWGWQGQSIKAGKKLTKN